MAEEITVAELMRQQASVQRLLLGHEVLEFTPTQRADYIRVMTLAAMAELTEALRETPWKPWACYPADAEVRHDSFRGELADVVIFVLNLALAGDISGEELAQAVCDKIRENIRRHEDSYDGHWRAE